MSAASVATAMTTSARMTFEALPAAVALWRVSSAAKEMETTRACLLAGGLRIASAHEAARRPTVIAALNIGSRSAIGLLHRTAVGRALPATVVLSRPVIKAG